MRYENGCRRERAFTGKSRKEQRVSLTGIMYNGKTIANDEPRASGKSVGQSKKKGQARMTSERASSWKGEKYGPHRESKRLILGACETRCLAQRKR